MGSRAFLSATHFGGTHTWAVRASKPDLMPGIRISMVKPEVGMAPPFSRAARSRIAFSSLMLTSSSALTPKSDPTVG